MKAIYNQASLIRSKQAHQDEPGYQMRRTGPALEHRSPGLGGVIPIEAAVSFDRPDPVTGTRTVEIDACRGASGRRLQPAKGIGVQGIRMLAHVDEIQHL